MPKQSAGILVYRIRHTAPEVLLAHPGGPFWKNKDAGAWSIPKGEPDPGEDPLAAAKREWQEETGLRLTGTFTPLSPVKQKAGKEILAWAVHADPDTAGFQSNLFETEWPPKSGKKRSFPEIDKLEWFTIPVAKTKINPGQVPLLEELQRIIG